MMKKQRRWLLLVLVVLLAIGAYLKLTTTDPNPPVPPVSPVSPVPTSPTVDVINEATGIYVGQIDNNSIEIKVNDKDMAFRFSDKLRESFASLDLEEGQMLKIKYRENTNNQRILEELTVIRKPDVSPNPESKTASGIYVGKIDNNSIEIKVNSETQAFWVAEELKSSEIFGTLKEGNSIEFEYYIDKYERSVITTLKSEN